MKKIILGRGDDCDIYLSDPKGLISRKHAIMKISSFGSYEITDVSKNGTFINGIRMKPHVPYKVKRKDIIVFANTSKLEWDEIPDHSKWIKIAAAGIVAVIAVAMTYLFIFNRQKENSGTDAIHEAMPPIERSVTDPVQTDADSPASSLEEVQKPVPSSEKAVVATPAYSRPKSKEVGTRQKTARQKNENKEEETPAVNVTEQSQQPEEEKSPGGD